MTIERKGIGIAGTFLADVIKTIDKYPDKTMLCNIKEIETAVGGCVPNTSINLARIDSEVPVMVYGKAGADDKADFVIAEMEKNGIDTSGIIKDKNDVTGFSDVMNEYGTGIRTFFTCMGANRSFDSDDMDFENIPCKILHAGYILLMEKLDSKDDEYGTRMARLLAKAQSYGIKTSIDTVSSDGGDFVNTVTPAIKYCDYVIMNETEACRVFGLEARDKDENLCIDNIFKAMEGFIEKGVKECVIIHCPEGGFYLDRNGRRAKKGSLKLPEGYIVGSTGAGDTFCAATLYGLYKGFEPEYLLEFAGAAAALNLAAKDAISGAATKAEIEAMMKKYETREI